ncbi:MAG: SH3 domain-containing protein [Pseudomonadota bacterium]
MINAVFDQEADDDIQSRQDVGPATVTVMPPQSVVAPIKAPANPARPKITQKAKSDKVAALPKVKPSPLGTEKAAKPPLKSTLKYVDASRLNVGNGPDKSSKVIWTLKRNQQVPVVEKSGDWSRVQTERLSGWVFSKYLSVRLPETANKSPTPQARQESGQSVAQIKRILMKRSVAYYSGNCPCP